MGYSRDHYLALMRDRYFGRVMAADLPAVLTAFTPRATIRIFNGDHQDQRFARASTDGLRPFETFFGHLLANYEARFDDFTWIVDPVAETGAAIFRPLLTPHADSPYASAGPLALNNCNFFWFEDGLIRHMVIYYANPGQAERSAGAQGPTPFPRV